MLVSVVIPCFNVELCVSACLDSALSQTYTPIEIICVDNNSTDGTLQILEKYHDRYPELIKVLSETEQGAPAARNKGLAAAQGKWIQFLDADDLLLREKIENQINKIQHLATAKVGVLAAGFQLNEKGRKAEFIVPQTQDKWLILFLGQLGITSSNLWSKEALQSVEGWDNAHTSGQEYELMFRLFKMGWEVSVDQSVETIIQVRKESITKGKGYRKSILNQYLLRMKFLSYILLHFPLLFKSHQQIIEAFAVRFLRDAVILYPNQYSELLKSFTTLLPLPVSIHHKQIGRLFVYTYNIFGFDFACEVYKWYRMIR